MAFIRSVGTIENRDDFFDLIIAETTARGWLHVSVNTSSVASVADRRIGREEILYCSGNDPGKGDPGQFWISMHVIDHGSIGQIISWSGWHGQAEIPGQSPKIFPQMPGGFIPILTWSQVNAFVTVTTDGDHGFSTGDAVCCNGLKVANANIPDASVLTPNIITVTGNNTFTFVAGFNNTVTTSGGHCWVVYNTFGSRHEDNTNPLTGLGNSLITDAPMNVFMQVTERFVCGVVIQGGEHRIFGFGEINRAYSTQYQGSSRARLQTSIIADGIAEQIITLDRDCPNLYVSQSVQLMPVTSAYPNDISQYESNLSKFNITKIDNLTQIRGVVPLGYWAPGTLIGADISPAFTLGLREGGTLNLNQYQMTFSHTTNGDRDSGATGIIYIPVTKSDSSYVKYSDPLKNGFHLMSEIVTVRFSPTDDMRGPISFVSGNTFAGMYSVPESNLWTDQDIFRTGAPVSASKDDYIAFKSINARDLDNQTSWRLAIGGDAVGFTGSFS